MAKFAAIIVLALMTGMAGAQDKGNGSAELAYPFSRGYGQVEVGGVFAGAEFHGSRPLPSRISLYYPVANSIDLSTDYWKRGESRPMVVGVRLDDGPKEWLGKEAWSYIVSPHRVVFHREVQGISISMTYEFFMHEPGMLFRLAMTNSSGRPRNVEIYTHLKLTLRTCQTYARLDSARVDFDDSLHAVQAAFDEIGAGGACVLVQNVAFQPSSVTTDASALAIADTGWSTWIQTATMPVANSSLRFSRHNAAAAFVYSKHVAAGDSLVIAQVIASSPEAGIRALNLRLGKIWQSEVADYNSFVRRSSEDGVAVKTGVPDIDNSTRWALGILAANRHYLDGAVVPMPCPAEYNFFFTHDVLLTDLGAMNVDLPRVKRDLLYIASHAKDRIIPHAYYWRDDKFTTEWCTPDNWNHLWFVLCTSSYLRHSLDTATVVSLYPLVSKSLEEVLTQCGEDNLMHAFRPDWWDLGHREGTRSYMTILTIRALREYLYLSAALGKHDAPLLRYEKLAGMMQQALRSHLWDAKTGYLTNFNGALPDSHFYMGSLLAVPFGLLGPAEAKRLVATATRELVDPRIGVHTVAPADFHLDSVRAFFKIAGNEAGDPYLYINGGVWPHSNAWYAIALNSVGRHEDAVSFLRRIMTIEGVMKSPSGQPAMFEYRYADSTSPEYGRIDKPSFLWAGGFYISTLYHLCGMRENEWNISVVPPYSIPFDSARMDLSLGSKKIMNVRGRVEDAAGFTADGMVIPSLVFPTGIRDVCQCTLLTGNPDYPVLEGINAILYDAAVDSVQRVVTFRVSSFDGHDTIARLCGTVKRTRVLIDGRMHRPTTEKTPEGREEMVIRFAGSASPQRIEVYY